MFDNTHRAFTLIEILIVVIILGILAALTVPQMSSAVGESAATATRRELQQLRLHVELYQASNSGLLPAITAGDGTWGPIVGPEHLKSAPINAWVGSLNGRVIVFGAAPDTAYQTAHGWIYDPATGGVRAGSFDASDDPIQP